MKSSYKVRSPMGSDRASATASLVDNGIYYINSVWVNRERRGQGWGSKLLKQITNDADNENIVLRLDVGGGCQSHPGLTSEQLCQWYKRWGFRVTAADKASGCTCPTMVRQPGAVRKGIAMGRKITGEVKVVLRLCPSIYVIGELDMEDMESTIVISSHTDTSGGNYKSAKIPIDKLAEVQDAMGDMKRLLGDYADKFNEHFPKLADVIPTGAEKGTRNDDDDNDDDDGDNDSDD